jgi:predicted NBD/HSP70 family sugar kinase
LDQQYPGFGALEIIASGKGIAERGANELAETHPDKPISNFSAADVFQAARDGETWVTQIMAETIDYLSLAIANVTVCFDPELVILGGGVSTSADLLINPIKDRITGVIPRVPRIEQSQLKDKAVILGAVVCVFQKVTDYAVVHRG